MTLPQQRRGFTLIELLIVIAVIGILAAVAMPKLSKARERGLYRSMMSDLRNMQSQQEIYRSHPDNNSMYAATTNYIQNFATSTGVTLEVTEAGATGWAATASHSGLDNNQICAVYAGTVSAVPAPATAAGVVTCTGER